MDSIVPFVFLPRYRVAVCEECGYAVVAKEVLSHLQARHRNVSMERRRELAAAIASSPGIIQDQASLVGFEFPPPNTNYIPQLAPPQTDGLKCRKCPYIARQVQKIQAHCREYHGWINSRGAGRPAFKRKRSSADLPEESPQLPWTDNVACQRFFPSRNASGWFEIERKSVPLQGHSIYPPAICEPEITPPGDISKPKKRATINKAVQKHIEAVLQRHKRHMEMQKEPRICAKALGQDSLAATSLWLERTQWCMTYRGVRRDLLKVMTIMPGAQGARGTWKDLVLGQGELEGDDDIISPRNDEQKIACVMGAIDLMIHRCETTARQTNRLLCCWLITSRTITNKTRAFSVMTEPGTRYRYHTMWKRFIAFVLRAYLLPEVTRRQVKVVLPTAVRRQIQVLWQHRVWDMIDVSQGRWPVSSDDRYAIEGGAQAPGTKYPSTPILTVPIENQASDDSYSGSDDESDWDPDELEEELYEVQDNTYDDDIADKRDITLSDPAGTEFLELLFQLSITLSQQEYVDGNPASTLLVYFSGIFGISSDYQRFLLAREFCPHLSCIIYIQRLLFLEYALPLSGYEALGLPSRPQLGQLERLKEMCSRYTTAGSPSALAELFNLRSFGFKIGKTEPPAHLLYWSDDDRIVSFGSEITLSMDQFRQLPEYFISRAEELTQDLMFGLPTDVSISQLKDDMTNQSPGYSFVTDPRNGLAEGYMQLLTHVCSCTSSVTPLFGHSRWIWVTVKQYLRKVTDLEGILSGGLYTSCGQTPRLKELVSLESKNSPSGMRSIYVWNGSVIYIIRHHKAKRTTNNEFIVVRFLPARLGVVLVKYLAYIRGVFSILRRELDDHLGISDPGKDTTLLFHRRGEPWLAENITSILRTAAYQVWGQTVTSQIYRQVAIGITEKHVREVFTPFNQYDDNGMSGDRNTVFAWQSGHRPALRGSTYGLDGAYPHRLQPSLLRVYEWASTRWHEFLHQASKIHNPRNVDQSMTNQNQASKTSEPSNGGPSTTDQDRARKRHKPMATSKITTNQTAADAETAPEVPSHGTLGNLGKFTRTPASWLCVEDLARVLPEHMVLMCLICKTAIRPGKGTIDHFRGQHRVKGGLIKALEQLAFRWQLLDPANIPLPVDGSAPIRELSIRPGYKCTKCTFISISQDRIAAHRRQQHPSDSSQKDIPWQEVHLQTFMSRKHARYWVVKV